MNSNHSIARIAGVLALALICSCAAAQRPAADHRDDCSQLTGTWEGTFPIETVPLDSSATPDEVTLRVVFSTGAPKVFSVERGVLVEVKSGSFAARCLGPSAVVHSIDSARDHDGRWYETWVLVLTMRDQGALLARWVRMVNNATSPSNSKWSKFSSSGAGLLSRG